MTNIDWTKPICIAATDWQGELPARVVRKETSSYWVAIDAPHKVWEDDCFNEPAERSFDAETGSWCVGEKYIRVINKIEKDNKMPTQKSLDEAAKAAGYSDWEATKATMQSSTTRSVQAHALTLDQLHGRVEVSEAERLFREVWSRSNGSEIATNRELDDDDLAAIAILEKALVDAANKEPKWIDWHGGECPVAPDTRVEVELYNGHKDTQLAKHFTWHWAYGGEVAGWCIIRYRVL